MMGRKAAPPVQELAKTFLKLDESDFDPVEKRVYIEPRPPSIGDTSHGVVKSGALVVAGHPPKPYS